MNINTITNSTLQLLANTVQEIGKEMEISENFLTKIIQKIFTDTKFHAEHLTGMGNVLIPVNIFILTGKKNIPYLHSAIKQWLESII